MKKLISTICGIILLISLTACGSKPALVGKWKSAYNTTIEFFSDGTCISNTKHGRYSIDGNRIKLDDGSSVVTSTFEIKGDTLILYDDNDHRFDLELTRVK